MDIHRLERLTPLSGIVSVMILVYGHVAAGPIDYFPTAQTALDSVARSSSQAQQGALFAGGYSVVFLMAFVGSVFSALREREGERAGLSVIAAGGGFLVALGLLLGYGIRWVSLARASQSGAISPEEALTMADLTTVMLANVVTVGLAPFIGATGIGSLRTRLFPTWLGWASVVLAAGLLTPIHYIFEGLALIWIVLVSVTLFLSGRTQVMA